MLAGKIYLQTTRDALFTVLTKDNDHWSIFLEGFLENVSVGNALKVVFEFTDVDISLACEAVFSWHRRKGGRRMGVRAGSCIALTPGHDLELLLRFLNGSELHPRNNRRFLVKLRTLITRTFTSSVWGMVNDLSEGGAQVLAGFDGEEGEELTLRMFPKGSLLGVKCRGLVRWSKEGEIGIEFAEKDRAKAHKVLLAAEAAHDDLRTIEFKPTH